MDEGGLSPGLGGDGGGLRREKSKENPQESPWGGEIPLQKSERYCKIENAYGIKAARFAALPAVSQRGPAEDVSRRRDADTAILFGG